MKRAILFVLLTLSTLLLSFVSYAQTAQELGNYTYDSSGNVQGIGPDDEGLTNFFDYDSAGRLIRFTRKNESSGATVITQTYEYDAYGNLVKQTTNGVAANYPAAATTNRLTGATYDAVGNMTARGSESYTYDPIGTLTQRSGSWGNAFYIYTADDERVAVGGPDGTFRYMARDLDGKVLREWSSQTWSGAWAWVEDYVYRGGSLVAASRPTSQGGDRHFHLDHLGTPRLITNSSATIYAEHAYYPFGREITSPTQEIDNFGHDTPEPMKFTGHERDFAGSYTGTALDYMHARYYEPQAGRFLSVDPERDWYLDEPQSWNMYSYARNNPVVNVDTDGGTATKFFVRLLNDTWRQVTRREAVKVAAAGERHAVRVVGPKASRTAKGIVKEAFPNEQILRHDPHIPGTDPHWQPKKPKGGHVGYEMGMFLLGLVPVIGWVADAEAANADEDVVLAAIRNAANSTAQQEYGRPFNKLTPEEQAKVLAQIMGQEPPEDPKEKEKDPNCISEPCRDKPNQSRWW